MSPPSNLCDPCALCGLAPGAFPVANSAVAPGTTPGASATNELPLDGGLGGWVRLAPYGDHPKVRIVRDESNVLRPETLIQRLTPANAQALVNDWRHAGFGLKRLLKSIPVFKGHPDAARPDHADRPVAHRLPQLGTIVDFEAREDGLFGKVSLSEEGLDVVNEGHKFISVHWWIRPTGEHTAEGHAIHEPVRLISGGLTDRPNIAGVESLANQTTLVGQCSRAASPGLSPVGQCSRAANISSAGAPSTCPVADEFQATPRTPIPNPAPQPRFMDKSQLIAALNQFEGIALTHESADPEILAALDQVIREASTHAQNRASLSSARAESNSVRDRLIHLHLDHAIADGRLAPAARADELTTLQNSAQLEADLDALERRAPVVKTVAATAGLGARKPNLTAANDAAARVHRLANEAIDSGKFNHLPGANRWEAAWNDVCLTAPELVQAMRQEIGGHDQI